MDGWHGASGQDLWTFHVRKALPAQDMVAGSCALSFARGPAQVKTQLMPAPGALMQET